MAESPAEALALLTLVERKRHLAKLSDDQADAMFRSWRFWSRPEQRAPDWLWRWWVLVTGRGFGKNRTGAEWVVDRCEQFAAHRHRHTVGLVNRTFGIVRALQVTGESGLVPVCERRGWRIHHPSTSHVGAIQVWDEGWQSSELEIHTADDPDGARGRNLHTVHADEAAAWRHRTDAEGGTTFTNLDLALRSPCPKGLIPQGVVTTTPKPVKLVRDLLTGEYGETATTRGSIYDNMANLDPGFIRAILHRYEGTRLGAQELHGELLLDVEGALWHYLTLENHRVRQAPDLMRPVVGLDPPGEADGAEAGIVVAALGALRPGETELRDERGIVRRHLYVIEDASVGGLTAEGWAQAAVDAYKTFGATHIVVEVNHGGDMCRAVLHNIDPSVPVKKVRASTGKHTRAEPVAGLYEQGRGHHVGNFPELEEQMTTWVPGDPVSPDRMDALVWAASDLLGLATAIQASIGAPRGTGAERKYG